VGAARICRGVRATCAPRRTTLQNRRAAARAAQRVIRGLPLPPGTRRLRREPAGWPDTYAVVNGSDRNAYQERWWEVALPRHDVLEYYVDHRPPGLRHAPGEDPYTDGLGVGARQGSTDFSTLGWKHWRRFSGPALVLDVATIGDRTVIHAYTQTSARCARTPDNQVTGEVTAVDVRRVRTDRHNHRKVTAHTFLQPTEPEPITRIVRSFNGLAGGTLSPAFSSCPIFEEVSYAVTFHTSDGALAALTGNVFCDRAIELMRDGRRLRSTLSPLIPAEDRKGLNHDWFGVLDRLLGRAS